MTAARVLAGLMLAAIVLMVTPLRGQEPPPDAPRVGPPAGGEGPRMARPQLGPRKKGLVATSDAAFAGYTLYTPLNSTQTYLIDMKGREVHAWSSKFTGQAVYLMSDGSILRTAVEPRNRSFRGGGISGRVERIAADGEVVWEFVHANDKHCLHHDIEPLPNGNILMIAWEKRTREEAMAAGRDPARLTDGEFWPDYVLEVAPEGKSGGKIVWEWHAWDHLIQQFDESKPNYGTPAEHPGRIDINCLENAPRESPEEIRRLRAIGYVGGDEDDDEDDEAGRGRPAGRRGRGPGGPGMGADWLHTNSIAYNAQLDQIVLSIHNTHEIWVIDHSTTTAEAKGSTGGRWGKGGDLLYRWGNPRAYGAGTPGDQQLFGQHDARWIPEGSPGAGNITIFNNGIGRRGEPYSSVVEIAPPIGADGRYVVEPGKAIGPPRPVWEYTAPNKSEFFSGHISGAERLPNGNTLVCAGEQGRFFEAAKDGTIVWEYWNPHENARRMGGPGGGEGRPGGAEDRPTGGESANGTGGDDRGEKRPRREPRGGPGGPGGPSAVFRVTRLAADHPGVQRLTKAASADGPADSASER